MPLGSGLKSYHFKWVVYASNRISIDTNTNVAKKIFQLPSFLLPILCPLFQHLLVIGVMWRTLLWEITIWPGRCLKRLQCGQSWKLFMWQTTKSLGQFPVELATGEMWRFLMWEITIWPGRCQKKLQCGQNWKVLLCVATRSPGQFQME